MQHKNRRLDQPRIVQQVRLVRAADTTHNLCTRDQVAALLLLITASRGENG